MQIDMLQLLPHLGTLHERVRDFEQKLRKEFQMPIEVSLTCISNDYSIDAIAKIVSDVLAVPMNHMLSSSRKTVLQEARMVAMYLCNKLIPEIQDSEITAYFGKERTSAVHARERINDLLATNDETMKAKLSACETRIAEYLKSTNNANDVHEA